MLERIRLATPPAPVGDVSPGDKFDFAYRAKTRQQPVVALPYAQIPKRPVIRSSSWLTPRRLEVLRVFSWTPSQLFPPWTGKFYGLYVYRFNAGASNKWGWFLGLSFFVGMSRSVLT